LHAHQASCASIKDGEEGRKEASFGMDCIALDEVDLMKVKREGFLLASGEIVFPCDEVIPAPPPGFRLMFLTFLLRGFYLPAYEFLRGLLIVYGVQLH
jgi:hypothetical protein